MEQNHSRTFSSWVLARHRLPVSRATKAGLAGGGGVRSQLCCPRPRQESGSSLSKPFLVKLDLGAFFFGLRLLLEVIWHKLPFHLTPTTHT